MFADQSGPSYQCSNSNSNTGHPVLVNNPNCTVHTVLLEVKAGSNVVDQSNALAFHI
mgnify:CR=1 FL=1